jgi:predicted DNA-binding transcriptional regulator AlpA
MAQVGDKYLTVKQVMLKYHLSRWIVYENIRSNPNFPVVNLGPKKNYRIPEGELRYWLMKRPGHPQSPNAVPTGADLLQELGL